MFWLTILLTITIIVFIRLKPRTWMKVVMTISSWLILIALFMWAYYKLSTEEFRNESISFLEESSDIIEDSTDCLLLPTYEKGYRCLHKNNLSITNKLWDYANDLSDI